MREARHDLAPVRYDLAMAPRAGMAPLRVVPRDGALLSFDPATGTNVLVRGPSTRFLRARAPRVVMFGLTNACNLRCGFCSRDARAESRWDEASAFELLAGLARSGVLEVALGGGEPLAFRGLDALLARLRAETPLAVHLTTNGVLLDDARLARLGPLRGEIRVSIYDDNPWPERIESLARSGVAFGANVLVTPARLDGLRGILARLESLGCPDVALLRYVGDDPALALAPEHHARVAELARATAMRVRASVCFGDGLALPKLDAEGSGDCAAGRDFVVVTSDRRVRACSFSGDAIPIASAADVIDAWCRERARLAAAVPKRGCARAEQALGRDRPADGVRVWSAFSGNNSGDCFLVGKFEREADARAYFDRVRGELAPGAAPSTELRAVFAEAGITSPTGSRMPEHLEIVGRTILAHTSMAVDDDFPQLRALVWAMGGRAVGTGVHEHAEVHLLTAVAHDDARALGDLETRALVDDLGAFVRKGDVLFGVHPVRGDRAIDDALELGRSIVREGGVASAELVATDDPPRLARALAARVPAGEREWLHIELPDEESAQRFARSLGDAAVSAGRIVLARSAGGARAALRAGRHGGVATAIPGASIAIDVSMWVRGQELDAPRLDAELRAELGTEGTLATPVLSEWGGVRVTVETGEPLRVLPFLDRFAAARGLSLWLHPRSQRPIEHALARLDVDVRALRRERR